jgi:threonine dehydrogenase-like Zn-dependent dehydrogenase
MLAALLIERRRIECREMDAPRVSAGEVLIQPARFGICGSDVSFYLGHRVAPYPFLLGHETVGRIAAVGEGVTNFEIGQRVIVEPNYPCGACAFCRAGRGNICPNKKAPGITHPGYFAQTFAAPVEFTWRIPDAISDADAVAIEPLCVSLHALWQSSARLGDTVAVIGCGATGLLLIHAAAAQGIRVIAHSRSQSKLEKARQLGADVIEKPDRFAETCQVSEVTTLFECAGAPAAVELALHAAPRGSAVVLLGLSTRPASFVPLRLVREGIRVSGSMIYDHPKDFARAIELVKDGTLHPSQIITDTLPFGEMDRALQLAATGQAIKIGVAM